MTEIFDKNNPHKIDSVDLSINDETAISINHMEKCNNLSAIYDVVSMYVGNCYNDSLTLIEYYNIYGYTTDEEDSEDEEDDKDITE